MKFKIDDLVHTREKKAISHNVFTGRIERFESDTVAVIRVVTAFGSFPAAEEIKDLVHVRHTSNGVRKYVYVIESPTGFLSDDRHPVWLDKCSAMEFKCKAIAEAVMSCSMVLGLAMGNPLKLTRKGLKE